jgi:hypothetical protein
VLFVGQTKYNRRSDEAQLFQHITAIFVSFFSLTVALLLRVLQEARLSGFSGHLDAPLPDFPVFSQHAGAALGFRC